MLNVDNNNNVNTFTFQRQLSISKCELAQLCFVCGSFELCEVVECPMFVAGPEYIMN